MVTEQPSRKKGSGSLLQMRVGGEIRSKGTHEETGQAPQSEDSKEDVTQVKRGQMGPGVVGRTG